MITPESVQGGDGSITKALELWSSRNDPIDFNDWQKLYWALVRSGFQEVSPPEEARQQRVQKIAGLWRTIQEGTLSLLVVKKERAPSWKLESVPLTIP